MNNSYEQRLKSASKIILAVNDPPPFNSEGVGVTATLKPHQVEGVSWLIRRYHRRQRHSRDILTDGTGKDLTSYNILELSESLSKIVGAILNPMPLKCDRWLAVRNGEIHVQVQSSSSDVSSFPLDILLTTYDIALIDQDFLSQFPWR